MWDVVTVVSTSFVFIGAGLSVRKGRPEIAEVKSFAALWGPSLLFAGLGVIFLFVGIGILAGWLPV